MRNREYLLIVALITIALLAIGGILWSMDNGSLTLEDSSSNRQWFRGASDAAVIIDVYPDFTCDVCVEKERMVLEALDIYPRIIKMVYHHYPISAWGQLIAEALEAAGEQGKFWELHDSLLESVPNNPAELVTYAAEIGLDIQRFGQAFESREFREKVELYKDEVVSRGVMHVAVFINGREYEHDPGTLSDLCDAIDEELERTGSDDGN